MVKGGVTWKVTPDDIKALEIGAGILGTGGGGNPYLVRLRALELLKSDHCMTIVSLDDLADDALVVSLAGIGAPVVGIERIKEGAEGVRALRALEAHLDFTADALACPEIGGANSMEPLIIAAQAGIPVVDCDGMGRAFPEIQMTTFSIYGHKSTPSAMADPHGNTVVFADAMSEDFHERMARAMVVAQGGSSTLAFAPMTGAFARRAAVPGTYTKAIAMGHCVLDARAARRDPIEAICTAGEGKLAFRGKITDLHREITGGFLRGGLKIEGFDDFHDQTGEIELQNEYLVFRRDGIVEIIVPDLIVVLDADDGAPLSTDMLRYGQRIAVLFLPAHPLMKTPEAMRVVGPAAFGYTDV